MSRWILFSEPLTYYILWESLYGKYERNNLCERVFWNHSNTSNAVLRGRWGPKDSQALLNYQQRFQKSFYIISRRLSSTEWKRKQWSRRGGHCVLVDYGKTQVWGKIHQGVWLRAQSNCDELWIPSNSLKVSPADQAMKNDMDKMFFPFSPMFVFSLPLPENDIL